MLTLSLASPTIAGELRVVFGTAELFGGPAGTDSGGDQRRPEEAGGVFGSVFRVSVSFNPQDGLKQLRPRSPIRPGAKARKRMSKVPE